MSTAALSTELHAANVPPPLVPHPGQIDLHPLRFTGSGREYFKVWIVNVLLSIITLSLYTPFARRRTVQYFYGHTLLDDDPFEFIGQQRKMVLGFLIFLALFAAFKLAQNTGQETAASLLIMGFAVLLPWLWASAMRFRMASTRWRGVRFAFVIRWREIYKASWPVLAVALLWVGILFAVANMMATASRSNLLGGNPLKTFSPPALLVAAGVVMTLLAVIRLEYNYKSLFFKCARIGQHGGRWKPAYKDFVRVWLATIAVFVLIAGGLGLVVGVLAGGLWRTSVASFYQGGLALVVLLLVSLVLFFLFLLVASLPARAYREARMFQLVWNNVGISYIARFRTRLNTWPFVRLRLKNMLLTLLSLGFYLPFARVSEYRAKIESLTLHVKGGTDQLVGEMVRQQGSLGDAAADAIGLDIIG